MAHTNFGLGMSKVRLVKLESGLKLIDGVKVYFATSHSAQGGYLKVHGINVTQHSTSRTSGPKLLFAVAQTGFNVASERFVKLGSSIVRA